MTRPELIDAMARAIYERVNGAGCRAWSQIDHKPAYRDQATAALAAIEAAGCVIVQRKLLTEAHAVMRECGWHIAPASETAGDGVLECAAAEIEGRVSELLAASPLAKDA